MNSTHRDTSTSLLPYNQRDSDKLFHMVPIKKEKLKGRLNLITFAASSSVSLIREDFHLNWCQWDMNLIIYSVVTLSQTKKKILTQII